MRARAVLLGTGVVLLAACAEVAGPPLPRDELGGTWAPWVLAEGAALRPDPPAPTGSLILRVELEEILARQATLTGPELEAIHRWDGPPSLAWNELLLDRLSFYWALLPDLRTATPVRAARATALLNVAIHDALIAVWDAKYAFDRPAPIHTDSRIRSLVPVSDEPSFPSEHAAAAAAAARILAYVLPQDDPAGFELLAEEAMTSRVLVGAAYRSDVDAGAAIGRAVAERVIARAEQDGSDRVWTGSLPTGPDAWQPTPPRRVNPPFDPLAGAWRPWVLASGSELRPAPPPTRDSGEFAKDLQELLALSDTRTVEQADAARFWATDPPSSVWVRLAAEETRARRLSPLRTSRALAAVSVALADAFIACWDGKFFYWLVRPISVAPDIVTVFATPPFPSYPSGHSTISASAAEALAALFPESGARYRAMAREASLSRVWGGVHYRFDITAGEELGVAVGQRVMARVERDGAGS